MPVPITRRRPAGFIDGEWADARPVSSDTVMIQKDPSESGIPRIQM